MKPLLALATLALTALLLEERARQLASDANHASGQLYDQAREVTANLSSTVERQPLISLLVAGGIAYVLASILPTRDQISTR